MNRTLFLNMVGATGLTYSSAITRALAKPAARKISFRDTSATVDNRVQALVAQLSLSEKISQLNNASSAIERLGIPAYDWWNEALHGVANNGVATVFPQAIGMAASWDTTLLRAVGDAVATEARAKYNETGIRSHHSTYNGLTVWCPNVNIARDPRWGRAQETYGEDPFLTSQMGIAYVRGLQSPRRGILKTAATVKHFAVYSGPEETRHTLDVRIDEATLHEFYLYAFKSVVQQGGVSGVMASYHSLNGTPCTASRALLRTTLRDTWHFGGYVTSDCGGVWDMAYRRHFVPDIEHAAAAAVAAGVDICCGNDFIALGRACAEGLITEEQIDQALSRSLAIRFRLGMFDEDTPFDNISVAADNDSPAHADLALQMARESLVLLKNDGILPLSRNLAQIAVIGPSANSLEILQANYHGTASNPQTILDGIRAKFPRGTTIHYHKGCDFTSDRMVSSDEETLLLNVAKSADLVIFVGGISPALEGEEMRDQHVPGFESGDRTRIELPDIQNALLAKLHSVGKPMILIQTGGSAIACPWAVENVSAILHVWYPGEAGGTAVGDVLVGDYNPSGKLPLTFYASTKDLPPFQDYTIENRTYRYFKGKPLFAFGHGLSYTRFLYSKLALKLNPLPHKGLVIQVRCKIRNIGNRDGDEVVQVYVTDLDVSRRRPIRKLCGFARIHLPAKKDSAVSIDVRGDSLAYWDSRRSQMVMLPGRYRFSVGAASDDIRLYSDVTIG